jgi:hypothetical protein
MYIGREFAEFPHTPFGNPFHLKDYANREECLLAFAEYWYAPEQRWLRKMSLGLEGLILACWCKPKACHGDIIAGYVDWKTKDEVQIKLGWSE